MPSPIDTIPQTAQGVNPFRELLYQLIVLNKYQKVLETGTDVGDSARIFSSALQVTSGQLVTVDIKPPVNDWPASWPVKNIQFVTGDSKQLRLKEEIDCLYLDAHLADIDIETQITEELKWLGRWVRVGGKIVLDDVFHATFGPGIRKTLEAFARVQQFPWTTYPQGYGLAVIEVTHLMNRDV